MTQVAMTIAGSDASSGAGLQADSLKLTAQEIKRVLPFASQELSWLALSRSLSCQLSQNDMRKTPSRLLCEAHRRWI